MILIKTDVCLEVQRAAVQPQPGTAWTTTVNGGWAFGLIDVQASSYQALPHILHSPHYPALCSAVLQASPLRHSEESSVTLVMALMPI